jgi:hypothetical protein
VNFYEEVAREWEEGGRHPPFDPPTMRAERWWLWHDRARAMTHALYADRGWDVLVSGPVSAETPIPGVAMIEGGIAREVDGDEPSILGAQEGIEAALTEISSTLADALSRLPAPLRPVWSGPIPLPPKE